MENESSLGKTIVGVVLAIVAVLLLWGSFYTIKSGQAGIELTNGAVTGVTDAGLHLKMPFCSQS
jgi:regulator of protease activity HflC (stomatin/prohibitin superfamily)